MKGMKRKISLIPITALLLLLLIIFIRESGLLVREGVDKQLARDALDIAETIELYHNDLELMYDDIPKDDQDFINSFQPDNYIKKYEEPSEEEDKIIDATGVLMATYMIHGHEYDGEINDYDKEINEQIDIIKELTKGIVDKGSY